MLLEILRNEIPLPIEEYPSDRRHSYAILPSVWQTKKGGTVGSKREAEREVERQRVLSSGSRDQQKYSIRIVEEGAAGERDFSPPLGKTNPHHALSTARRWWRRRGREARRGRLARVVSVVAGGGSLKNTPQPHRAAPPQKPPSSTAEPKRDRAS